MITLYQYLHCPYCVRADMVANYTEIPHKKVYLLNDDEETCFRLINAKMVPILELEDGTAMAESMDIAQKLNEMAPVEKQLLKAQDHEKFTEIFNRVKDNINALVFPRDVAIPQPEYATPEAISYFTNKKEKLLGESFASAMAKSAQHIDKVQSALESLPTLSLPSSRNNQLSWDDVYIYPTLRNLTMVKGLVFPSQVLTYVNEIAQLTSTHLYFNDAL